MQGVLTPAIELWNFGSPWGLPSAHFGSVSLIFTLSQSRVATYNAFTWKKKHLQQTNSYKLYFHEDWKTIYFFLTENLPNQLCCPQSNSFLIFIFSSLDFLHQSLGKPHSTPPKMHPTKPQQQSKCHRK